MAGVFGECGVICKIRATVKSDVQPATWVIVDPNSVTLNRVLDSCGSIVASSGDSASSCANETSVSALFAVTMTFTRAAGDCKISESAVEWRD